MKKAANCLGRLLGFATHTRGTVYRPASSRDDGAGRRVANVLGASCAVTEAKMMGSRSPLRSLSA